LICVYLCGSAFYCFLLNNPINQEEYMQRQCFDRKWRFKLSDPLALRWSEPDFSNWRELDLPHDWSIEMARAPDNPSGAHGGYFPMGLGLYYKTFVAPEEWQGKKVLIEFEGVYMNAEVSLNDNLLGRHPYGYTTFAYDLTPYLKLDGSENVLRVVVDNAAQRNSRWYSGSGIYRHVWLMVADPVHVAHWGVYVTTPEVTAEKAVVHAETTVENESPALCEATVRSRVVAADGTLMDEAEVRAAIDTGGQHVYAHDLKVVNSELWSPAMPYLYQLETEVLVEGDVVDTVTTPFGIRTFSFDAEQGFVLNDQPMLLKGGCVHHDNGVMGAAAYDRSEERKVELLKASGYNAIRCAHNPPSPAFLDACDRLGMLVIDEAFDCWREGKNLYDYHVSFADWWCRDLNSMLYRDRNHPSIIMWSIGNEVRERAGQSGGVALANALADHVRAVDPTRPVTAAINGGHDRWPWAQTDEVFAALGVGGYNYQERQYRPDHERCPGRVMYGSESTPGEAFQHWMSVLELDHVVGDFVWTSLDYLGESGIGRVYFEEDAQEWQFLGDYPWHQANCGDLDLCGFKRPQSYYRDIIWERGRKLYIAVHDPVPEGKTPKCTYWGWPNVWPNWTWPGHEGEVFQVDVYAACDKVELFLNDESLGVKPTTREEKFMATFEVPYQPGALKAVGYIDGEPVTPYQIETVDAPAKLRLTPDRDTLKADAGDLSFVIVEVVDQVGRVDPNADHEIFFTVQGPGIIAAVGNGNPVSTERYRGNHRRAYRGRCLVVVKADGEPGEIRLRAQADGLDIAEIVIQVA
jgi:beta-galactosidase